MRALLLILLIGLLTKNADCQPTYIKNLPYHPDSKFITFYRDSLICSGVQSPFFTFFTHEHKKEITYFIWLGNRGMNVIQITDSTISKPLFNCPQKFAAILKPNQLAISETENKLRFIPPINAITTNVLFAEMHSREYLVEHGSNTNYILDKTKDKARSSFFKILLQDLEPLRGKWTFAAFHQRY